MKITPSNQTLILASERGSAGTSAVDTQASSKALLEGAAAGNGSMSDAAAGVDLGTGDSVLKRVTIVTAHPDSTMVYLQADYAASDATYTDISPNRVVATVPAATPSTQIARSSGVAASRGALVSSGSSSAINLTGHPARGIALYASTQNILLDATSSNGVDWFHIDVHA